MSRIDYASRLAQWMRIAERDPGKGFTDVRALTRPPNVPIGPHERAMMEELNRLSNKPVVAKRQRKAGVHARGVPGLRPRPGPRRQPAHLIATAEEVSRAEEEEKRAAAR
ncbi:hypothetical protein AB0L75_00450 [Streptomyces sp. NPDC052101]|uniref:hypothetical protein n=1 Tax=Streptomyces sp. NPDC052101 TaxID=3155763 RepID=UPI003445A8EC